jgi:hypothetical protein
MQMASVRFTAVLDDKEARAIAKGWNLGTHGDGYGSL